MNGNGDGVANGGNGVARANGHVGTSREGAALQKQNENRKRTRMANE